MGYRYLQLSRQLEEVEANLALIEERWAKYVLDVDVPLQLVKERKEQEQHRATLRMQLELLRADRRCPYRGLEPFKVEHAEFFFGRDRMTEILTQRVEKGSFVAVVGPSGSGKSSLVRAGLMHVMRQGGGWRVAIFKPGASPLHGLSRQLLKWLSPDASGLELLSEAEQLAAGLRVNGDLPQILDSIEERGGSARHLLIVDQFEELYSRDIAAADRECFVEALLEIASRRRTHLVVTLRADFFAEVLRESRLGSAFDRGLVNVLPPDEAEIRAAIERPAEKVGRFFERGLVERILDDVAGGPGHLPLLQFALTELWSRQTVAGVMTHSAYEEIGEVEKALALYAENVYEQLSVSDQQRVKRVLIQMVHLTSHLDAARRRARRSELGAHWDLVAFLADERLVVTGQEGQGEEVAELAHEALIAHWQRLRLWIEEDRTFRAWQERLRTAQQQWQDSDQDSSVLLRGRLLNEAVDWVEDRGLELSPKEQVFIQLSKTFHNRELQRRRQRLRRGIIALVVGLTVTTVLAFLAVIFAGRAKDKTREAKDALLEQERQTEIAKRALRQQETQTRLATSRFLALESRSRIAEYDFAEGLLLSIEAQRIDDTVEARGAMLAALSAQPRMLKTLRGHQEHSKVVRLAFSDDGKVLETGDNRGVIWRWNLDSGQPIGLPGGRRANWLSGDVAYSRDGSILASAEDGESIISLWDLRSGQLHAPPLVGHDGFTGALALSPDGRLLASAGLDETIRFWTVNSGQPSGPPVTGHSDTIVQIAFSPDGQLLASSSCLNLSLDPEAGFHCTEQIRILSLSDRQWDGPPLISPAEGRSSQLVFSPDGRYLAVGRTDGTVVFWDLTTRTLWGRPLETSDSMVSAMAFNPTGDLLAIGSCVNSDGYTGDCRPGRIVLWDLGARRRLESLEGHADWISGLSFSPDSRTLASGARDGTVVLWDLEHPQPLSRPFADHEYSYLRMALSPDGALLAVGGCDQKDDRGRCQVGEITFFDTESRQPVSPPIPAHSSWIADLAFSPDGHLLVSGGADRRMIFWDVSERRPQPRTIRLDRFINGLAFRPDGELLAIAEMSRNRDSSGITFWHLGNSQRPGGRLTYDCGQIFDLKFSPDGNLLAAGCIDGRISIWDLGDQASGRLRNLGQPWHLPSLAHPRGGTARYVTSLEFSPDGRILAAGYVFGLVALWDPETKSPLAQPLDFQAVGVKDLAFSSDGAWLAVGTGVTNLVLWEVATRRPLNPPLTGFGALGENLAFSPDDHRIYSSLALIPEDDPTGWLLAERRVVEWNVDVESWKVRLCDLAGRNLTVQEWKEYRGGEAVQILCPDLPFPWLTRRTARRASNEIVEGNIEQAVEEHAKWLRRTVDGPAEALELGRREVAWALIRHGWDLASDGQLEAATQELARAQKLAPDLDFDPRSEVAWALVDRARQLATYQDYQRTDPEDVETAAGWFQQALEYDPGIEIDVAQELVAASTTLIEQGQMPPRIDAAMAALEKAREIDPSLAIPAGIWDALCWFGSARGYGLQVLQACDKAVAADATDGRYRDSRGLSRAMTGDLEGALGDFRFYLDWARRHDWYGEDDRRKRRQWIAELEQGANPFAEMGYLDLAIRRH